MAGDFDPGVAGKYQFVVVAIVACGVFAAGVITIMYRRRRQRAYLEQMGMGMTPWRGNTRLLLSDNGVLVEVPTRPTNGGGGAGAGGAERKKRRKLGPEPKLWDVEVGECVEDSSDDEASFESIDSVDAKDKGKTVGRVDVDEWQPVSIILPPHASHDPLDPSAVPDRDPNADITLLIAMPDRALSCPPDDGDLPLLQLPASACPRDADDFEAGGYAFPTLQLGTANVNVNADWAELDALKSPKPPKAPRQPRQRRTQELTPVDRLARSLFRPRVG